MQLFLVQEKSPQIPLPCLSNVFTVIYVSCSKLRCKFSSIKYISRVELSELSQNIGDIKGRPCDHGDIMDTEFWKILKS